MTLRVDSLPAKIVAYERVNQMRYSLMAEKLIRRVERYGGIAYHDSTGVGVAVNDNFEDNPNIMPWSINKPDLLYSPYIMAVQDSKIQGPKIATLDTEHKYLRWRDLSSRNHTPDSVCAKALAWQAYRLHSTSLLPSKKKKTGKVVRLGSRTRRNISPEDDARDRYYEDDIEDRPTSITSLGDLHYGNYF